MPPRPPAIPKGDCPDRDRLLQFEQGRLSAPEIAEIELHISSCESCVATLYRLQSDSDDTVIASLKRYWQRPHPSLSPDAAALEAQSEESTGDADSSAEDLVWRRGPEGDRHRMIGRRIGPYEVVGIIGRGGMGVVYEAIQRPLERRVAIKMILAGHHASATTEARFFREAKAVARLTHPNVVRVYDLGEHEGLPYLSMEFIDGVSLEAALDEGPLEPRAAAGLVATLAATVQYAHDQGVVHRDLKPANILLTRAGVPKVADFGLAKLLDSEPDDELSPRLTGSDAILGTASYMAPEQAAGRPEEIGQATDIHALGAILFAALTGHPPFVGGSKLKILELVRSARPVPPSQLSPDVPKGLEAICLTCLEKDPARRYRSAQALADDLGRWLRSERLQGARWRLNRLTRRVRTNLIGLVCSGAILAVTASFALYDPDRALAATRTELALGRAVSLIGPTGAPNWYRWRLGKSGGHVELAEDRTCTVTSWDRGLLELLPDPQSERYRITAQVRHDISDAFGEVGLYFSHRLYPHRPADVQFLTQLTFNDTHHKQADLLGRLPDSGARRRALLARGNPVELLPRLLSEEKSKVRVDSKLPGFVGARFTPLGQKNGRWNDLEVVVSPTQIAFTWNGQRTVVSLKDFQTHLESGYRFEADRFAPGMIPKFTPRGGIGLYVSRGSASFRNVSVVPLKPDPPRN